MLLHVFSCCVVFVRGHLLVCTLHFCRARADPSHARSVYGVRLAVALAGGGGGILPGRRH